MEKWHAAKPGSHQGRPRHRRLGSSAAAKRRVDRIVEARAAPVHGGVRPRARRGGAPRSARDRHHRRDGRRDRPLDALRGAARPVLRRRHRRAARRAVRRRPGARGDEARRRDLLDLPAARLRPDRPRRLPAEAERRLLHGPRRPGRRRRPDASRQLRHLLPAADPEHGRDGAARRGDAGAHAAHRAALRRRPDRAALPARRGGRRRASRRARSRSRSVAARCSPRASGWRCSATAPASSSRSSAARLLRRAAASARRSATPASPSRSTPGWSSSLAAEHELLVTVEENVLAGGFGSAVLEHLSDRGALGEGAARDALRHPRPLRHPRQARPAARGGRPHAGAHRRGRRSRRSSGRRFRSA